MPRSRLENTEIVRRRFIAPDTRFAKKELASYRTAEYINKATYFAENLITRLRRIEHLRASAYRDLPKDVADTAYSQRHAFAEKMLIDESLAEFHSVLSGNISRFKEDSLKAFFRDIFKNEALKARALLEVKGLRKRLQILQGPAQKPEERLLRAIFSPQNVYDTQDGLALYDKLMTKCVRRTISPELWKDMLIAHSKIMRHRETRFRKEVLPRLKANFLEKAKVKCNTPLFPISFEKVQQYLDMLQYRITDGIVDTPDDYYGFYSRNTEQIVLMAYLLNKGEEKDLEHTFAHEIFHALSGRTHAAEGARIDKSTGEVVGALTVDRYRRVGLRQLKSLTWLNEAVTEELCSIFLDVKPRSYKRQRTALAFVRNGGAQAIPLELFAGAYFEDWTPGKSGETIPHWRALMQALRDAGTKKYFIERSRLEDVAWKEKAE